VTPGGGSPEPPVAAFAGKTLVTLKLAAGRIASKGPLAVKIRNTNGFAVTGKLSGETVGRVAAARKRRVELKTKAFRVATHASKTVKLSLPRALVRLLARKHKLALRLTAKVTDPAGHTRTVKKRVTPKLKKKRSKRH
jgi:hypothetical protein